MLLILDDDLKKNINILNHLEHNVSTELCITGLNYLRNGINRKVYTNISLKLDIDENIIRNAIEGIMFIMIQSVKFSLSDTDLKDSLNTFGLNEDIQNEMVNWYCSNKQIIREILTQMDRDSSEMPHYTNLEWRFETQIASRSLRDQLKPNIVLRFEFESRGQKKFVTLNCDAANLFHLRDVLEEALAEARSQHLLKIARHFK